MIAFDTPADHDNGRRLRTKLSHIPFIGRLLFPEERSANQSFKNKQNYVGNYIDSELRPYLVGSKELEEVTLLHGFFKDIQFTQTEDLQAGIAQKLYGVYEVELTDELNLLTGNKYDFIINIGAAEGLYSLAFEKIWRDTPIYSFEQDYETRELLREMCSINNSRSVIVLGEFDLNSIKQINSDNRGLIFCDCEGFEGEIFAPHQLKHFANCDLVIETHDHIVPSLTDKLITDLSKSHTTHIIEQFSLEQRAAIITEQSFKQNDSQVQINLLNENRDPKNCWVIAQSINIQ